MIRLTRTKLGLIVSFVFMLFWIALPIIGSIHVKESMSFEESSASDGVMHRGDIIDENMTFLFSPEKVSVKVNDVFSVQVCIENVTDMFGWQVSLYFDPIVLECVDVCMPFDHVLSYGVTVGGALVRYNATEFTDPLYRINNDEGRVLVGNCLLGSNQSTFNGSGPLCQVDFKAISTGLSDIELHLYSNWDSFVLNSGIRGVKPLSGVCCSLNCTD